MENILEEITKDLFCLLPKGWNKVVLYSDVEEKHYNIFFYVKTKEGYVQCYNLESLCGTTEAEIDDFVEMLYEKVLGLDENVRSQYTVVINSDLSFLVDYCYEEEFDLIEWKNKYLI